MKLSDFKSDRKKIFALNGKTEEDMAQDLLILREWMKKLPHIPSDQLQDEFLEIHLIKNKFSVEKTKSKIEEYCTMKACKRYQYLYERYLSPSKENIFYIMNPQLTEDLCRIHIGIIRDENEYSHLDEVMNIVIQAEVFARCDYSNGGIFICDYTRCSLLTITKYRVNYVADCAHLFFQAFSQRVKAIHFVNKNAKPIVSLFMKLMPAKIASRCFIHDDFDSLKRVVPAKYLPSDFGGEWKSYDESLKDWDRIYEEDQDLIKSYIKTKAKEELRQGHSNADEMNGTFKKLGID